MKLCRHIPVDHPLALQFQRAVESLTAAQVWDSARQYRGTARDFLIYLGENHPDVTSLNQLCRDPHILGWFTRLRSLKPAVYISRLMRLRCILEELAWTAQLPDLTHLIRREDSPRPPQRLPRALTTQQDRAIQQELLRRNDLAANIFLLLRHTGMRIGESVDLSWDCLRNVAPDRWAIHVPLGKLKTERMVPVDSFVCELVQRLRFFRSFDPLPPEGHLLSRPHGKTALIRQLRYYLPALMKLLGHSDPGMTMRYVEVAGNDLQREYRQARLQPRHLVPQPKAPLITPRAGLDGVIDSLLFAQHAIEMFRRSLPDASPRRCLDRLSNRLIKILSETRKLNSLE